MATSTYELELWCLIQGGNAPFSVIASSTIIIRELSELIRERLKNGVLQGVDARYLILKKVEVRHTTTYSHWWCQEPISFWCLIGRGGARSVQRRC